MKSEAELLKIGTGLLDTSKYQKAIDVFSEVIEINSENSEAYELRGIANFRILNIENAMTDISKAIAINPDSHQAWFNKGEIFKKRKNYKEAEICYLEANKLYPDSLFYLSGLIQTNHALKKYDDAISYCDQILKENPEDSFSYRYRGMAYGKKLNYEAAIKDYLKLIEIGKRDESVYNSLGYWYSKIGEFKNAFNNLSISLQMNSTHPYALDNMGYVKYAEGNYKKAMELINRSLDIDPSNSYAYKNRALVHIKVGDRELAIQDLRKAESLGYQEEYGNEVNELLNMLNQ